MSRATRSTELAAPSSRGRRARIALAAGAFAALACVGCEGDPEGGGSLDPDSCAPPEPFTCPVTPVTDPATTVTLTGTTIGGDDSFAGASCASTGGSRANDIAFSYLVPQTGTYTITTAGSDFDTLLTVREHCAGEVMACNDDMGMGRQESMLRVDLEACQTVLVVVDANSPFEDGDVRVQITPAEVCDDGADNDGDGAVDCDDDECFSAACLGVGDWPPPWASFEDEVLRLTNEARARGADCGPEGTFGPAPPLEMSDIVRVAARQHSTEMGEMAFFAHDSPDGRTPSDRMSNVGFNGAQPWGENIASGYASPEEAVAGWMSSPGHCANIMNPAYRVLGAGYAQVEGSPLTHYWTQKFAGSHQR